MEITTRLFNEDNDAGFIFSTLPKGIYHASFHPISAHRTDFFEMYYDYLKNLIKCADINIACTLDNPQFIVGYSIISNMTLEWVYVKTDYRNQGIATLLIKNKKLTGVNENNLTILGHDIMQNHKDRLKPKKEESTDETKQDSR